ncbi:MAG: TolB family protein, partial [Pseudonocardiaceae bacterium]
MTQRLRAGRVALVALLTGLGLVSAGPVSATVPGDNGKIAYVRDGDVWVMDPDGTNQQNLTTSPDAEADPAFSPDGTTIAFSRGGDIWVMNADGTNQMNLTNDSAPDRDPDWSPDGMKLVFASDRERFDAELGHNVAYRGIYVMDTDGSDAIVLRETSMFAGSEQHWVDPTWSVDGAIAFTSNDTDQPRIAAMNATDGTAYALIGPLGGASPSWSPDGAK